MRYSVTFFRPSASASSARPAEIARKVLTNRPPCRVLGGRARTARIGELADVPFECLQGASGAVPGRRPRFGVLRLRRMQQGTGGRRARRRRGGGGHAAGRPACRCRQGQRDERRPAARGRRAGPAPAAAVRAGRRQRDGVLPRAARQAAERSGGVERADRPDALCADRDRAEHQPRRFHRGPAPVRADGEGRPAGARVAACASRSPRPARCAIPTARSG